MSTRLILKKFSHRFSFSLAISAMTLVLSLASTLVSAADIYGRIFIDNKPAANQSILVNDKPVSNTDASGSYRLSLPPGNYELTIEGREPVTIVVPPAGVKQDIRLR